MRRNEEHLDAVFAGKASLTEKGMRDFFSSDEEVVSNESLDQAISEFNDWNGAAKIYFKKETGIFFTEVFSNDVAVVETVPSENIFAIYGKEEIKGDKKVTDLRRKYIEKYAQLLLEGRDAWQAEMDLAEFAYQNNI